MLKKRFDKIHHREIFLNMFHQRRFILILLISISVLILGIIIYFSFFSFSLGAVCGDGTPYGKCSSMESYYCAGGKLIEKASVCGCVGNITVQGDSCVSKYMTQPRNVSLNYTLRGEKKEFDFVVYDGIKSYMAYLPRSLSVLNDSEPTRADFKFQKLDDEEQTNLLLGLVVEIQNLDVSKKDKLRIAVSLVQEIEFGKSDKIVKIAGTKLDYSRYPYEVLLESKGVCGERSELLVFILREMGYDIGFFYYPAENHEAVAVKCPWLHDVKTTDYCLIETTGPSIMTDKGIEYVGIGELESNPEVVFISEGKSLGFWWYEYRDANRLNWLRKGFAIFQKSGYEKLREKYNLGDVYNV
jgi:hypothetical protein